MNCIIKNSILLLMILVFSSCTPDLYQIRPDIPNGGRAVAVSVDPNDDNNIIVASESGGLFLSNNHGFTWEHVSGNITFWFNDVLYLNTTSKIILAAALNDTKTLGGGGVYRSQDQGKSWSKINIPFTGSQTCMSDGLNAYSLCVERGGQRVWVGTSCGLAFSDNDGLTWTPVENTNSAFDVKATSKSHIIYSSGNSLEVTNDGGANWVSSKTGIPGGPHSFSQSQIAVSPVNESTIFWTFYYYDVESYYHVALFCSTDNGQTWSEKIFDKIYTPSRPSFIALANSITGYPGMYDVYFGDGSMALKKFEFFEIVSPVLSSTIDLKSKSVGSGVSVDFTDMGFSNDGKTPLILVGDHGILLTKDGGLNWTLTGGGKGGYNAQQIYEVTGQLHADKKTADVYFSTQDNYLYASPDNAESWLPSVCCEGFNLNIPRDYYDDQATKLVATIGGPFNNFISGKYFNGIIPFANATSAIPLGISIRGTPKLLIPGSYIQQRIKRRLHGVSPPWGTSFDLTLDNGMNWTNGFNYFEHTPGPGISIRTAGNKNNPTIIIPVLKPLGTPNGDASIGLKRVTDFFSIGGRVVSDITGFGSLGTLHLQSDKVYPFAISPANVNQMIIPDVTDNAVKATIDGGTKWDPINALTNLVTQSGTYKFSGATTENNLAGLRKIPFTQVTAMEFCPSCPDFIIVGTKQAGMFSSNDNGTTWEKINNSDEIPNISSFFFGGKSGQLQEVFISSYGRGLWRYIFQCPFQKATRILRPSMFEIHSGPLFYANGIIFPLSDLTISEECKKCAFCLVENGDITNYVVNKKTMEIEEVILSQGRINAFSVTDEISKIPFRVSYSLPKDETNHKDSAMHKSVYDRNLLSILEGNIKVRGLYIEGNYLKGVLLSANGMTRKLLPKIKSPEPEVDIVSDSSRMIKLIGRGFDVTLPLEIKLDNDTITALIPPVFNTDGTFTVFLPPSITPGFHMIVVEQKNEKKTIRFVNSLITNPGGDKREE